MRAQRELLGAGGNLVAQLRGTHELGTPDLVARLEVVEVLVARDGLDDRQRLAVEDRHSEVAAVHMTLEQDAIRVGERGYERGRAVACLGGELDPQCRPL